MKDSSDKRRINFILKTYTSSQDDDKEEIE